MEAEPNLPEMPDVNLTSQDQEGSEEELESSGQTPKKRKLDSIRAGLPAHGLRITQSQVMRMLKMIQEVLFFSLFLSNHFLSQFRRTTQTQKKMRRTPQ